MAFIHSEFCSRILLVNPLVCNCTSWTSSLLLLQPDATEHLVSLSTLLTHDKLAWAQSNEFNHPEPAAEARHKPVDHVSHLLESGKEYNPMIAHTKKRKQGRVHAERSENNGESVSFYKKERPAKKPKPGKSAKGTPSVSVTSNHGPCHNESSPIPHSSLGLVLVAALQPRSPSNKSAHCTSSLDLAVLSTKTYRFR